MWEVDLINPIGLPKRFPIVNGMLTSCKRGTIFHSDYETQNQMNDQGRTQINNWGRRNYS